jgi:hypothetical protein
LLAQFDGQDRVWAFAGAVEIRRRLRTIKSTRLATQCLLCRDEKQEADAFDGLVACCQRAKGKLFVVPEDQDDLFAYGPAGRRPELIRSNIFWETRDFLQEKILEILLPYRGRDLNSVLRAALANEFRYIPRLVRLRLIDHIRRYCRNRRPPTWSLNYHIGYNEEGVPREFHERIPFDFGRHGSTMDRSGKVRDLDLEDFPDFLARNDHRLRTLLGEAAYQVLEAIVLTHYHGPVRTCRERKGKMTKAIARHRGVSEQQARTDKRKLVKVCSASLDPILRTVYGFLREGLDMPSSAREVQEREVISFSPAYAVSSRKFGTE